MHTRRWMIGVAVAALVLGVMSAWWLASPETNSRQVFPIYADIGGGFTLTGSQDKPVSLSQFRGKLALVFFGYTHCPDVCPTALYVIKQALERLGPHSDAVQVIMISVDPERDSAKHLQDYVSYFDPRFIGVTGAPAEIAAVAKRYMVQYEKEAPMADGQYNVNHTVFMYLLDKQGRTRTLFDSRTRPEKMAEDIAALLAEG